MSKQIVSEIPNRDAFFHLLKHNPGLIVIKLGAEWCGPCKQIKNVVHAFYASSPPEVVCADIDVDQSFDFYAFLKSKKMVNGIPVLLCYKNHRSHRRALHRYNNGLPNLIRGHQIVKHNQRH